MIIKEANCVSNDNGLAGDEVYHFFYIVVQANWL